MGIYVPRSALKIGQFDYIGLFNDFKLELIGFVMALKGWVFKTVPATFLDHILVLVHHFFKENYLYCAAILVFDLNIHEGINLVGFAQYFGPYSGC